MTSKELEKLSDSKLSKYLLEEAEKRQAIYHYTTIDSLYKILLTKSFRFSRIDQMNDLLEAKRCLDLYNNFYVLSFSHSRLESIPLWNMYAKEHRGVIIRFTNNYLFDKSKIYFYRGISKKYFVRSDNYLNTNFYYDDSDEGIYAKDPIRIQVIYSDDAQKNRVGRKVFQSGKYEITGMNPNILIGIKTEAWKHENELRYYIRIEDSTKLNVSHLYAELSDDILSGMQIIFNPFLSDFDKNSIKQMVSKLLGESIFQKVEFKNSSLEGSIR